MGRKGLSNYSRGRRKKSMDSEGHKANVTFPEDKVDFFSFILAMVSKCSLPVVLNSKPHIVFLLN